MTAKPITNREPGLPGDRMNAWITIPLPIVPDTSMKEYNVNLEMSFALNGRRWDSGYTIGGFCRSKI